VKRTIFVLMILIAFSTVMISANASTVPGQKIRVTLKEITPFPYVSVRHQGPLSGFEDAVAILMSSLGRQNISPAGNMFAIMHKIPKEGEDITLDWEVSFPITAQVYPQPPLTKGLWEYSTVASATHTGPIPSIGETVDEVLLWVEQNGHAMAGPILAVFLNISDPDTIPSRLQTEIWVAIEK
jgi:effector-binding domain-containing protein